MATATITAFKFDTPDGAEQMLDLVKDLSKQQLITLQDAAIVTWPAGKKKPKTKQLTGKWHLPLLRDGARRKENRNYLWAKQNRLS